MTTAREVISGTLRFHLNRLSPGETLDDDTADVCLEALNHIVDEWNGSKAFLFREILSTSTAITGATGTLGVDWPTLASGDEIFGATIAYTSTLDVPLQVLTMGEYANIALKAISTLSGFYAHDGAATVYFYPTVPGKTITLRTREVVSDFAGIDTSYVLPKGYKAWLSAVLAERLAPTMVGGVTPPVASAARNARSQLAARSIEPAIINGSSEPGRVVRIKRGY